MSDIDVLEILVGLLPEVSVLFAILAAIEVGVRLAGRSSDVEPDRD